MSMADELTQLGALHQRGVLSDDEFARAKTRVLSGVVAAQGEGASAINRLRRSRSDRWLGGVCAGIGQLTGMAPWIWRLLLVALVLCGGTGVFLYALLWILVPLEEPPLHAAPRRASAG